MEGTAAEVAAQKQRIFGIASKFRGLDSGEENVSSLQLVRTVKEVARLAWERGHGQRVYAAYGDGHQRLQIAQMSERLLVL